MRRYRIGIMLGLRFVDGMRTITPLILGMDRTIRFRRFVLATPIGAALWSTVIAVGGYFFGRVMKIFWLISGSYELVLLLVVLLIGSAIRFLALYREKEKLSQ